MSYSPGDVLLDKYRIEALVGAGAYAEVYRVTHLGLNATRAVKLLRRDAPSVDSTLFAAAPCQPAPISGRGDSPLLRRCDFLIPWESGPRTARKEGGIRSRSKRPRKGFTPFAISFG